MADTISSIGTAHLRYHRWAVLQFFPILERVPKEKLLADHGTSFGSVFGTMAHVYLADSIWLARLRGDAHARMSQFKAPESILELTSEWTRLLDDFTAWADRSVEDDWISLIDVVNSKGVASRSPVWQVVFQVVNHATGHLGQVKGILRQIGLVPPPTDLILFYRLEAS